MAPDGGSFPPDGLPVEFDIILPTTEDFLKGNVAYARGLGLPEADDRQLHLNLVANGPSAAGARLGRGQSMAVNGAINLFPRHRAPNYWCVSDPQGPRADGGMSPADFLKRPSRRTTYLVASKCHKTVFDRLKGYDVRIWHLSDTEHEPGTRVVPCATTVTLTALLLAQRIGFRSIDVWGWDCCFGESGAHHAAESEMGATASEITVRVGPEEWGKEFKTTPTWAMEAQEAVNILPLLRWSGVDVVIHGDGMVRAIAAEYAATPLPGLKL